MSFKNIFAVLLSTQSTVAKDVLSIEDANNLVGIAVEQFDKTSKWSEVVNFIGKYYPKFLEFDDEIINETDGYDNKLEAFIDLEATQYKAFVRVADYCDMPNSIAYYLDIIYDVINEGFHMESKDMGDSWVYIQTEVIICHKKGLPVKIDAHTTEKEFANYSSTYLSELNLTISQIFPDVTNINIIEIREDALLNFESSIMQAPIF
jgi:hypothetical protein